MLDYHNNGNFNFQIYTNEQINLYFVIKTFKTNRKKNGLSFKNISI